MALSPGIGSAITAIRLRKAMSEVQPGLAQPNALRLVAQPEDDVVVGQILLARPDRGPDVLVLIIEVHDDHVQGALCDDDHHLATDTDCVLEPWLTGYPRLLHVHGDVSGRIVKRRLTEPLGRVDPELVARVALRGRGLDFNSSDLGRGRAIAGESDPRWEWKLDKFRQLRTVHARASELGWEVCKFGDAGPRGR
jgi:hypothetical protein